MGGMKQPDHAERRPGRRDGRIDVLGAGEADLGYHLTGRGVAHCCSS